MAKALLPITANTEQKNRDPSNFFIYI